MSLTSKSVMLDPKLMYRALANLIGNAIKYSPQQGHVRFVVTHEDDLIIFRISDNGIGIAAEDDQAAVRAVLPGQKYRRYRRDGLRLVDCPQLRRRARGANRRRRARKGAAPPSRSRSRLRWSSAKRGIFGAVRSAARGNQMRIQQQQNRHSWRSAVRWGIVLIGLLVFGGDARSRSRHAGDHRIPDRDGEPQLEPDQRQSIRPLHQRTADRRRTRRSLLQSPRHSSQRAKLSVAGSRNRISA